MKEKWDAPKYGLGADIAVVDVVLSVIEVECDDVHQLLLDECVVRAVERHVAHVVLVGEQKPGVDSVASFARVLVQRSVVVRLVALAVVAARSVAAVLRTHPRRLYALVHVSARLSIVHQSAVTGYC